MHLVSNGIKTIPGWKFLLYLIGIISAKNLFCDGAAVSKETGSCLPGNSFLHIIIIYNCFGIRVLVFQIVICQTDVFFYIKCIRRFYIFPSIIRLDEKKIHTIIINDLLLVCKRFIQVDLISIVVIWYYEKINFYAMWFSNICCVAFVYAFKFIIPAIYVYNLSFIGCVVCFYSRTATSVQRSCT